MLFLISLPPPHCPVLSCRILLPLHGQASHTLGNKSQDPQVGWTPWGSIPVNSHPPLLRNLFLRVTHYSAPLDLLPHWLPSLLNAHCLFLSLSLLNFLPRASHVTSLNDADCLSIISSSSSLHNALHSDLDLLAASHTHTKASSTGTARGGHAHLAEPRCLCTKQALWAVQAKFLEPG